MIATLCHFTLDDLKKSIGTVVLLLLVPMFCYAQQSRILALHVGDDENIYVGTETRGLFIFDKEGNKKAHLDRSNGLYANQVRQVLQYSTDNTSFLVLGIPGYVAITSDGGRSFNYKSKANGLLGNIITSLKTNLGDIYVGTDQGLSIIRYDKPSRSFGNIVNKTMRDGLPSDYITSMAVITSNTRDKCTLFVGTTGGVGGSKDCGLTFSEQGTTNNGLPSNSVVSVWAMGDDHITWSNFAAGTNAGFSMGPLNFPFRFTETYTTSQGLGNNYVTDIGPKHFLLFYSNFLIATTNGLGVLSGSTIKNLTVANGFDQNHIQAVDLTVQYRIVVATTTGVFLQSETDFNKFERIRFD